MTRSKIITLRSQFSTFSRSLNRCVAMASGVLLTASISACGNESVKSAPSIRPKSLASPANDASAVQNDNANALLPDGELIDTTYAMVIRSKLFNMEVCSGDLKINVSLKAGAPTFTPPKGVVECLFGIKMDMAQMMSGISAPPAAGAAAPGIVVDGKIVRLQGIGTAKFQPARPFLLSIFAEKPENLAGFTVSENITATDTKDNKSASGNVGLNVIAVNETVSLDGFSKPFTKNLVWEITSSGFVGVNRATMFLFDKVEFTFNLDPIAIPKIQIVGKLKDFMAAAPGSTGASALGSISSIGGTGGGGVMGGVLGGFIGGATGSNSGSGIGGILGSLVGAIAGTLTVDLTLKQQKGIE